MRYLWLFLSLMVARAQGFTLEQVMSAPWPSELTASAPGGKLAWVFSARGVRNIWVAEPPDYRAHAITAYTEDDGQELSDLSWTPDERAIVYTRGDSANRLGEYPNPRSLASGETQEVWLVSLSDGKPRSLGEGSAPAVSGRGVAYLRKGQVWLAPLDGAEKATQMFRARGQCRSLRWSPDGGKLAFVSDRTDHGFIGVYDVGAKSLRYLDASLDLDSEPAWSPDGREIAFLRVPPARVLTVFGPRRASEPWSIRIADAASGQAREVFRAAEGKGSVFRDVTAPNQVMWMDGGRLLFPWERDGWTHLYTVPVGGGAPALLTPGEFEVEHVALTPDRKEVVYSSNQDDIDRRHLWRSKQPLTSGAGIEWGPVVTAGAVAFFRSDAQRPARVAIRTAAGEVRDLAPETMPRDFPTMVTPQQVILSAADGMRIHGQLFLPANMNPREHRPAVIFFHGGSRRQMLLGWHYMYYYNNSYALNQFLASRGYIVLSVNYRSGTGYGMEFREALNYGARGASEYNDVVGAALYLRGRPDVDPKRIGLWGGSYGGYLTALGLARASDLFAAGVDFHGVHDWRDETRLFVSTDDLQTQQEALRLALASSPMADVDEWRSPVLLIHGDDDRNVAFNQSVRLAEALRARKVEYEQLIFPDEIHDFLVWADWVTAYEATAAFLDKKLK